VFPLSDTYSGVIDEEQRKAIYFELVTFISRLMHSVIPNVDVKIYIV